MPIGWAIVTIALWLAVICLAVVVLGVLRQLSTIAERTAADQQIQQPKPMGPAQGTVVPKFAVRATNGEMFTDDHLRDHPSVLLFMSSHCGPCQKLAGEMRDADLTEIGDYLTVVTDEEGAAALGLPVTVRTVEESTNGIAKALEVKGRPFAVAIDENGVVRGSNVPSTVANLSTLIVRAMSRAR